jgi:uncharacterized protein YukE
VSTPVLSSDDQIIASALAGLDHHISAMIEAGNTVERINEEVAAGYIAHASTVFQNKVNDWVSRYKQVMQAFEHLMDSTSTTQKLLNQAEEEAQTIGGNWGASDGVFNGLTPA